jgi:hypothetical protein
MRVKFKICFKFELKIKKISSAQLRGGEEFHVAMDYNVMEDKEQGTDDELEHSKAKKKGRQGTKHMRTEERRKQK